jgi:DNA ligase-1
LFEQMTNTNEAQVDELGHTKRSTAKAGKVGANTLGGAVVTWFNGKQTVSFSIAPGGTVEEVAQLWEDRHNLIGKLVTFKYNGIGVNGRPRFPIWKVLRSKIDV